MPGTSREKRKDTDKIRRDGVSHDRRETDSTDRTNVSVGQYSAMNEASDIIDTLPNRSFNVIVLSLTNNPFSVPKHQRVATVLPLPSAIVRDDCDETFAYTSKRPLYRIVNFVHHQFHVEWIQKIAIYEQVKQRAETRLTKD